MQHQISLITLGVTDFTATNRFYQEGFGWTPAFTAPDIVFYQMNGFILGTYRASALADDMALDTEMGLAESMELAAGHPFQRPAAVSLAHNVRTAEEVEPVMASLIAAGGTLLRAADAPPHGGLRGYVSDPDGHAWEIAWHPMIKVADDGRVSIET